LSQDRVERVVYGYELFNRGELDQALEGFDDEIEWVTPDILPDPGPFRGAEGVRQFWTMWREIFTEFQIQIEEVFDLDEYVVVQASVSGIGRDSGAEVSTPSFPHVWTWRDDKIVKMEMFQSTAEAQAATGKSWDLK
jgi:ketosteroid isomerase-like protein